MKVTVVGGGNVGTQLAVHSASKGYTTIIYTPKANKFDKRLRIINEEGQLFLEGDVIATDDLNKAFSDADVVFITLPAPLINDMAKKMKPYLKKNVYIGIAPGTGGGECAFKDIIDKGAVVFGLQRVPSVARLIEYGKTVKASGYRSELYLAAIPNMYTQSCCDIVSEMLNMPCRPLPNYLNVTLTPSNPILHTTRLKSIFWDYTEGKFYDKVPLFYEEWSEEASEDLIKCDEEVQNICNALVDFDLKNVKSLKLHYESNTVSEMTQKLCSIKSLKGIKTPSVKVGEKYLPDFSSRYFTADFPYGLEIIVQIAKFADVNVPNCERVLQWYYNIVGENNKFSYSDFDINCHKEFLNFYMQ